VTTWVPTCTPTTCERLAEIRRSADAVLLARSVSTYVVVDAGSGRPRRLTAALRAAIGNPAEVRRAKPDRSFPSRPDRCIEAG
jgi:acyl-CoA thioesterase FadM